MKTLTALAVASLLASSAAVLSDPRISSAVVLTQPIPAELEAARIERDADRGFQVLETIVLVRVIDSTFPTKLTSERSSAAFNGRATARVLKAWKGPFAEGAAVDLVAPQTCGGPVGGCDPYLVQRGDELLIFAGPTDPLVVSKGWTRRADDSIATMAVLDELTERRDMRGTPIPRKD